MIHRLAQTTSTQDVLHQLAADGAAAGVTVVAREQSAGRGARGRAWHSPAGGLWMSVLLRPVHAIAVEVLSLRVGLLVADVLAECADLPPVGLKWPNDLLIDNRKVGGILCEARWQGDALAWIAVGLGVNVSNAVPRELAWTTTRLANYCPTLSVDLLIDPVREAVLRSANSGSTLDDVELASFAARDWLFGKQLDAPAVGVAAGIDHDGALIVRSKSHTVARVRSGTVVLAPGAA